MRSIYSSNDAQLMEAVTATIDEVIIQENISGWTILLSFLQV
jgi:hypothetical protein